MVYNFKEYKPIFDTPMKKQQEMVIARKIMDLLNKNKYDDLEKFISKNNNYQDFLKNNNMQTVIKHFGNTLKEEDYIKILENLKTLTKTKQDFDKDNIKTTKIGNNEYNSLKGKDKTYFVDNSRTDKSIENQMKDIQNTEQKFQTSDTKQNTENMFNELESRKKEGLNLIPLKSINFSSLNQEQQKIYQSAYIYQQSIDDVVRLDINKCVIVDSKDNIVKLEKKDNEYVIINEDNMEKNVTKENSYVKQKSLVPSPNTIYSN